MDDPAIDPGRHDQALRELARLNGISRTARALYGPIRRLARTRRLQPVRILDIACGAGDVARSLADRLDRAGVAAEVCGCDLSPTAVSHAERRSGDRVRFFTCDALAGPLPDGYDVVTCSLFLHHLDERQTLDLLGRMREAARHMVLISDLHRSRLNLAIAYAATRLFSRSPVVRFDGPVSVLGAYTAEEMAAMVRAAGLAGASVRRHWACRYLVTWERDDGAG